jgi:hypothetical protein
MNSDPFTDQPSSLGTSEGARHRGFQGRCLPARSAHDRHSVGAGQDRLCPVRSESPFGTAYSLLLNPMNISRDVHFSLNIIFINILYTKVKIWNVRL